ncbi:hypothetical protein FHS21_006054 [Phyllobacterium trifolii]|uniref:Uncharacterized protein n=1 Tax=Phyllobacterium trifolii TaxID=300193 RepID=A0A839UL53_9HYPH|nr:hypothetical protein [Phyllobacterium trifolii]
MWNLQNDRFGPDPDITAADLNVCFRRAVLESCLTGIVKSFGRQEAYESPRGRNPRTTVEAMEISIYG